MAYEFLRLSGGLPLTEQDRQLGGPPAYRATHALGLTLCCLSLMPDAAATRVSLDARLRDALSGSPRRLPPYLRATGLPDEPEPLSQGVYSLYAHLWGVLGLSTTPLGVPGDVMTDLLALTADGAVIFDRTRGWATFQFGDGQWGQGLTTAYLLRESALAGLILYNEGVRTQNAAYLQASWRISHGLSQRFRQGSASGVHYSPVVSRGAASSAPDAEAYALATLLCLRWPLMTTVRELLACLELAAVGRVTLSGAARGYSGASRYNLSPHVSALSAAAQIGAGQLGQARATLAGLTALRDPADCGVLTLDGLKTYAASMLAELIHQPGLLRRAA